LEFRPFFVAKCVVVRFLFTWKKGKIMESGKKVLMVKKKSVDSSVFCTIAASDHVPSRNFQIPNPLQIFKIMFVQPTKKRNADINKKNTEKKQHGSGKKRLSNHFLPGFFLRTTTSLYTDRSVKSSHPSPSRYPRCCQGC